MASNIYHVVAIIIGGTVLMIFLGLQTRSQESAIEATQYSSTKARIRTAIEMIERDFRNMGGGKREIETVFPPGSIDTTSCRMQYGPDIPCRFTFWGRVDSVQVDTSLVVYEWNRAGQAYVKIQDPDTPTGRVAPVVTYELRRYVNGVANTLQLERVRDFQVRMFDDDGLPISGNAPFTRKIDVELAVLMPRGDKKNDIEQAVWKTSIRPVNLTR